MKKIIILCFILILILSLVACGPDYSDELEDIEKGLEKLTEDWVEFGSKIGERATDIKTNKELYDMYDSLAQDSETYIEDASSLLKNLERIKEGISDVEYDAYLQRIKAMEDAMSLMKDQFKKSKITE